MKKNMLSRVLTLALAALLALPLFACGKKSDDNSTGSSGAASYQVGICSYADDASLNQIVDSIESRLKAIGQEKGVTFEISYDNCNTDSAVLNQIIANFMADKVDLMIGVATPVAVAMQAATEALTFPWSLPPCPTLWVRVWWRAWRPPAPTSPAPPTIWTPMPFWT